MSTQQLTQLDLIAQDQQHLSSCLRNAQIEPFRYRMQCMMDSVQTFVQCRLVTSMAIVSVINTLVLVLMSGTA